MKLEDLGFTREELQQRVVEQAVDRLLQSTGFDEDGDEFKNDSPFKRRLDNRIKDMIDAKINALAAEHVLPNVHEYIDKFTLQATTAWGERKGDPLTFVEYLVKRAEAYMQEQVDFDGKGQSEDRGYNWKGRTTRLAYAIDKHLQYSMETAAKHVLTAATEQVGEALAVAGALAIKNTIAKATDAIKKV